jgi:hypothetical protein
MFGIGIVEIVALAVIGLIVLLVIAVTQRKK